MESLRPVSPAERWAAAASYFGILSLVFLLWGRRGFVVAHARFAFWLHLSRLAISGIGLGVWHFMQIGPTVPVATLLDWGWHLLSMFVLGVPVVVFGTGPELVIWLLPAILIWLIDLFFFVLAFQGRALPWHDAPVQHSQTLSEAAEKERLRRLQDERLKRIGGATSTAASERQREQRIAACKRELGANLVRLDHLNHLLAMSELSMERYHELAAHVQSEITSLREELAALGGRLSSGLSVRPVSSGQIAPLGEQLQARALSLSFVDRSGVPLFTYGQFPLDEALVGGMLSAFDSISREIFGSSINKTQLTEGQILFFFHGQWCILMVLFDTEPSPRQVQRMQSYLATFEQTNAAELQRNPVEAARLTPVAVEYESADHE